MNNKRRRRKTVLDLNSGDEPNLDATSSQAACPKKNGLFGNSLTHLLEQYNSDSDDDAPQTDKKQCLNEKVNDFFKEIQCIAPKNDESCEENKRETPKSVWQECFDESTGYPYYWHIETNQVTWEIPKELELFRKNGGSAGTQAGASSDVLRGHRKLPPEDKIPRDVVKRHRHRQEAAADHSIKDKRKATVNARNEDSDDGRIEMITSFGSDNTDSDRSDDGRTSPNVQLQKAAKKIKHKSLKVGTSHLSPQRSILQTTDDGDSLQNSLANGDPCDEGEDTANNCISSEKSQKNSGEHERELKFSLVPGYADDSENEDNLSSRKRVVEPLFPSASSFDNSRSLERTSKIDINIEESGCSQTFDSQEASNTDDTRIPDKIDEVPKTNRFLEGLGTATKAFQRKKRIAFDVTMNKSKKSDPENTSRFQAETTQDSSTHFLSRGNDERHGLGFSKCSSDDADPISNSSEETSHVISAEKKEGTMGKSSIGFVKGETLTLNQNVTESEKNSWTQDTQMIAEKLKFLSEGSPMASAVQIMNIQLQTLLTAWEAGDLKDRYFFNWLSTTNRELCRLEKAAAPPGWDCQWDPTQKRYFYRNESDGETRWSYPDIIGGAEEMELCTTPPPPELDEKEKSPELQSTMNRVPETLSQQGQTQDEMKQDRTSNIEADSKDKEYTSNEKIDEVKIEKIVNIEPRSPSPPPPPRICAEDLKRDRRKRRDADRHKSSTKNTKKEEGLDDKACKETEKNDEKDSTAKKETISPDIEPAMTSAQIVNPLLLAPNPPHAEPLPPGVDQPEMPYAIAAATIEPSVIFSAAAQQANASIYAAAMPDPSNISIIGHHHPALVQNQLVHYPAYHSHLQNQAIIAAANRLAGPEAVQFMLDYTRIYANSQVIAKPPIKMNNESLGTALDSFYNDIATLESQPVIEDQQQANHSQAPVLPVVVQPLQSSIAVQPESQQLTSVNTSDSMSKDKKKKKVKIVISKKQKQVSSMVAKWKKAQNYEGTN